jgi:hypothetical protein
MPNSVVFLDFQDRAVRAELVLPWAELQYGLPADLAEPRLPASSQTIERLAAYLREHVGATTPEGRPWAQTLDNIHIVQSPDHLDLEAHLTFTPPRGADTSALVLRDSAVIHIVMSHVILVFDRQAGAAAQPRLIGVLQNPKTMLLVRRQLRPGEGFVAAFKLGMRHIAQGADHLLFLFTLLLPAPLLAQAGRWTGPKPARQAVHDLIKTVTAFTIGHSITLIVGAGFNLRIPQQPVEAAIAASIMAAAAAAWRPLLGHGKSAPWMAGGFGLIHGLAFSAALSEYALTPRAKAQAIAGFNLGIEAVQLALVLAVAPILLWLARTRAYPRIRLVGAGTAAAAAAVWAVQRLMIGA